jgi:hypothetical protein
MVTCDWSIVLSGFSDFLHQYNFGHYVVFSSSTYGFRFVCGNRSGHHNMETFDRTKCWTSPYETIVHIHKKRQHNGQSCIGGGNRRTRIKQSTSRKSLIKHTSPWVEFKLTTLVVIGADCICSCNSSYDTIMTTVTPLMFRLHRFWVIEGSI